MPDKTTDNTAPLTDRWARTFRFAIAFCSLVAVGLLFWMSQKGEVKSTQDGKATTLPLVAYGLCFLIAAATATGLILVAYWNFGGHHSIAERSQPPSREHDLEDRFLALCLITIIYIVAATTICAILQVDANRYQAIFAAIAGYVLGKLGGKHDKPNSMPVTTRETGKAPTVVKEPAA